MNDPAESAAPAPPAVPPVISANEAAPAPIPEIPTAPPPLISPLLTPPPPIVQAKPEPNPVTVVSLYLIAVFLGAALVAPRLYHTVHFLAEEHPMWRPLAEHPFHRYVSRCLILLALIGLPTFLKGLRIRSKQALGLRFRARDWIHVTEGIAWGFFALAAASALALSFGARIWDANHDPVGRRIGGALLAAVLVAAIEELLFRGALFGTLRRRYSFWRAAIISSGFYALVHFFEKPTSPEVVEWFSGLTTLGQMLGGFTQWHALIPGFFNLALIGIILSLAFERTGSLAFSFGVHAGLIFCVKLLGVITKTSPNASAWAWGGNKLVDGWAPGFILLAILLLLNKVLPSQPRPNV